MILASHRTTPPGDRQNRTKPDTLTPLSYGTETLGMEQAHTS